MLEGGADPQSDPLKSEGRKGTMVLSQSSSPHSLPNILPDSAKVAAGVHTQWKPIAESHCLHQLLSAMYDPNVVQNSRNEASQ